MRILVSEKTYQQYAKLARSIVSDPVFILFGEDATMATEDGTEVPPGTEDAEVVWATHDLFLGTSYRTLFDILSSSATLRWFSSPGAGVDGAFFEALVARGIHLTSSHATSIPIAEFVMRSILDLYQRPDLWSAGRAARRWDHHVMREVHGTTWLIFGLGAIGTEVSIRARAFGARTIGCRRSPTGSEPVDEMVSPAHVLEHVGVADVVVVAAPATPQTRHVVGEAFLSRMKPRSILVNVARGSLVDETALLAALANGTPEMAVLDALAAEPPPLDSPLWDHPGVVLTPHNAFAGEGNDRRNIDLFLENLRRYVDGEALVNDHLPPSPAG